MSQSDSTRRAFLQTSVTTAGATALASSLAAEPVHGGADETLRVGLVGCGGRGTDAVLNALAADPQTKLVALGDAFSDRVDQSLNYLKGKEDVADRIAVTPESCFSGFDNYKQVIDSGIDVLILATPPHFRPQHLRYAVEADKHVFVEKPVAVDAPGVRHVEQSCEMAKERGLSIVSGLCWRYDLGVRETMRKILEEKAIGEIIAIESSYNAGTLWHRGDDPAWSRMEYQMRNWLYYTWLSGDHILEQAIHSLDKTAWLMGDISPIRAMAMGGRQQRTDPKYGHVYDHFTVFYEYPNNKHVYFTCRQQDNTTTRVDERVLGDKGQAEVLRHQIRGENDRWRYRGPKPSMYVVEHQHFFKSIREGKPINNGHYMCNSTMIALMGRMAAYTGKTLTWDECYNSELRLGPSEYEMADVPEPSVAIPGTRELA